MTVKIGITGGIGSGKKCCVPTVGGDGKSRSIFLMGKTKQLMMTDSCIRSELTALLGEEVYAGGVLK